MTDIETCDALCGNCNCMSYIIEGLHACQRCADIAEQDEMRAEGEFYREMGDPYGFQ